MNNSSYQVLLVEDNEDDYLIVRDLFSDILTPQFELHWVDNYRAARQALAQHHYDVCLLDYRLGEATGVELAHEYGAGETPFILLTGNEDYEIDVAATKAGIADYLVKGHINAPLLERSIRYSIERKKTETALFQAQSFAQATVDALPANIAVINEQGIIVAVNAAWRKYAAVNRFTGSDSGIGVNYLEVCRRSNTPEARASAAGIRAVIAGQEETFCLDYPCHSPHEQRWFQLSVTRFAGVGLSHVVVSHQDITPRKLAEEQIRFQAHLIEAVGQAVIATDLDGSITYWNHFAETLYGWTAPEVMGRSILDIVPAQASKEQSAEIMSHMSAGKSWSGEFSVQRRDGTTFCAQVDNSPIYDSTGKEVGIIGVSTDITERKREEQELRESEERKSAILETALDCIIGIDAQNRIIEWNPASEKTFGYRREEAMGELMSELIIPEALHQEHYAGIDRYLTTGESKRIGQRIEVSAKRKNGEVFPVELTVTHLESEGQPIFIAYLREITERKQAEATSALLSAIVESSEDAIISKNLDGIITSWNAGAQNLYGYTAQEAVGLPVSFLAPSELLDEMPTLLEKIRRGESVNHYETMRARKDGSQFEISLSLSPLKDAQGNIVGVSSIKRDITEAKRAAQKLQDNKARFESIVMNVPGLVYQFVMQPDGSISWAFVGEGFRELFEVGPEILGKTPSWPMDQVHPDDRSEFDRSVATSREMLLPRSWEGRLRLASGKIKWIQINSRPQRLPDGGIMWNGLILDVTARKEAEDERDRFFTMSLDMLCIADHNGVFKRLNPAFEKTLGYSNAELMAKPFLEWVHPDDIEATVAVMQDIDGGASSLHFANRYLCRDGSYRWLSWVSAPYEGLIYAAAHDVTDLKNAEAALQKANDELEQRVEDRTTELERANEETRTQARQQEMVAELGRRALTGCDMNILLSGATTLVAETLEIEVSTVLELLPDNDAFFIRANTGFGPEATDRRVPMGNGSQAGYLLLSGTPVIVTDLPTETRFTPSSHLLDQGIVSGLTVIIPGYKQPFGTLGAHTTRHRHFTQDDVHFLQSVANVLAAALEQRRAEESLHKSHEFLEAVLENTAEGIVACDTEGKLTFFNRATRDFHGLPVESLPAEQWSDHYSLFLSDGITPMPQTEVPLFKALAGNHVRDMEMVIAPHEGNPLRLVANGGPLYGANGEKLGALAVMHDVTARKRAEEALRVEVIERTMAMDSLREVYEVVKQTKEEAEQAREEADSANRAKSEFLSRMSHELRTPLNAILGFGQVLEMGRRLDDRDSEAVSHILKGGRHLLGLINEVLDIASIEAKRISLSPEPILFSQTIREVLDMVRPLATTRRIQLVNEVAEDERYVRADQQRFHQVLLNLLANAIKYNCDGGRVTVSCAVSGTFLRCQVSDTGSGLTTDEIGKLFVPFERLGAAQSRVEGTGLGLALCKKLVEAMEGQIGVDSVPGQGSTFWVGFPLAESQSVQVETRLALNQEQIANSGGIDASLPQKGQRTVLYIEDNLSNFKVIESLLTERPQIKLLSAMQGSIGLDLACQHLPDLILLDLHLPDISGDIVLRRLRAEPATREIPVVVLSADATPSQVDKLRAAGIEHYLTKPIDLQQFLSIVDEILNKEHI